MIRQQAEGKRPCKKREKTNARYAQATKIEVDCQVNDEVVTIGCEPIH